MLPALNAALEHTANIIFLLGEELGGNKGLFHGPVGDEDGFVFGKFCRHLFDIDQRDVNGVRQERVVPGEVCRPDIEYDNIRFLNKLGHLVWRQAAHFYMGILRVGRHGVVKVPPLGDATGKAIDIRIPLLGCENCSPLGVESTKPHAVENERSVEVLGQFVTRLEFVDGNIDRSRDVVEIMLQAAHDIDENDIFLLQHIFNNRS